RAGSGLAEVRAGPVGPDALGAEGSALLVQIAAQDRVDVGRARRGEGREQEGEQLIGGDVQQGGDVQGPVLVDDINGVVARSALVGVPGTVRGDQRLQAVVRDRLLRVVDLDRGGSQLQAQRPRGACGQGQGNQERQDRKDRHMIIASQEGKQQHREGYQHEGRRVPGKRSARFDDSTDHADARRRTTRLWAKCISIGSASPRLATRMYPSPMPTTVNTGMLKGCPTWAMPNITEDTRTAACSPMYR